VAPARALRARTKEETGEVYAADDVHAWLTRLASGREGSRPKPWGG
jgi:hypothetical protein